MEGWPSGVNNLRTDWPQDIGWGWCQRYPTFNPLWSYVGLPPSLDFNPAETLSLIDALGGKDIIQFSRAGIGYYVNSQGGVVEVPANQPRFHFDQATGRCLGVYLERAAVNLLLNSAVLSTQTTAAGVSNYYISFVGTGQIVLTQSPQPSLTITGTGQHNRVYKAGSGGGNLVTLTVTGDVRQAQLELRGSGDNSFGSPTSWIPTGATTGSRAAETMFINEENLEKIWPRNGGTIYFCGFNWESESDIRLVEVGPLTSNDQPLVTATLSLQSTKRFSGALLARSIDSIAQPVAAAAGAPRQFLSYVGTFSNDTLSSFVSGKGRSTKSKQPVIPGGIGSLYFGVTDTSVSFIGNEGFAGTINRFAIFPSSISAGQASSASDQIGTTPKIKNNEFVYWVNITSTSGTTFTNRFTPVAGTYDISWGDGLSNLAQTSTVAHVYSGFGLYRVTITYSGNLNGTYGAASFDQQSAFVLVEGIGDRINLTTAADLFTGTSLCGVGNLNFSSVGTSIARIFQNCTKLQSVPLFNTAGVTDFTSAFDNTAITELPEFNTSSAAIMTSMFFACTKLRTPPAINYSTAQLMNNIFANSGLVDVDGFSAPSATNLNGAWENCASLKSFPQISFPVGQSFGTAWRNCDSLTTFPAINFPASATTFAQAWASNGSMTTFGACTFAGGTDFSYAWEFSALTSFPAISFPSTVTSAFGFFGAWRGNGNLSDFPANAFNNCTACNQYGQAWNNCALTAQSIENILTSLVTAGATGGTLGLLGGTNAAQGTWSTAATNARATLVTRGWTITNN
jgi:hypothetical protein